jgi:hypothetical protein
MSAVEDLRWNVETSDGSLHDVGATGMSIHASGALVFIDADGDILFAYAPHAWVTVGR